jgi:RHS repeat-associated protein
VLHQGGRQSGQSGLYQFRNRELSAGLGVWNRVDPLEYHANVASLYQSVLNSPIGWVDPAGLQVPGKPVHGVIVGKPGELEERPIRDLPNPITVPIGYPFAGRKWGWGGKPGDPMDDTQNCMGVACGGHTRDGGRYGRVIWPVLPGSGIGCTEDDFERAIGIVPKGCKRVSCEGLTINRTRCDDNERELILWIYRDPKRETCAVHMIGRGIYPGFWCSKQDGRWRYDGISGPRGHLRDAYKDMYEGIAAGNTKERCFCCKDAIQLS